MSSLDILVGNIVVNIITPIVLLLYGVALVFFIWGLINFIRGADNEEARSTGQKHMLWGIVGLFIMTSAYAIMCMIARTLSLPSSIIDKIPLC